MPCGPRQDRLNGAYDCLKRFSDSDLTGGRKIDPQTLIVHADHGRTGHPGSGPNICLARNRACKASSDAAPGLTGELESDPRIISQPPSELN